MTEVTVEITNYCPFYCDYCSSNAGRNGKHLQYENILKFLDNIQKKEKVSRINISGGEPLSHPHFYDILWRCYAITSDVRVYTNMIKNIIYNSDIVKEIEIEANVCVITGRDVYVPKLANKIHLLKLVHQGRAKKFPKQSIVVSKNFYSEEECEKCDHILLQADGQIVSAPCMKKYKVENYEK